MKAAIWHRRQDVRIQNVAEPPPPSQDEVQVNVASCGIYGTDLHEYLSGPLYIPVDQPHALTGVQAPVIIGHEMSGIVTTVGEGVENFSAGDRMAAWPIIGWVTAAGVGPIRWRNAIASRFLAHPGAAARAKLHAHEAALSSWACLINLRPSISRILSFARKSSPAT